MGKRLRVEIMVVLCIEEFKESVLQKRSKEPTAQKRNNIQGPVSQRVLAVINLFKYIKVLKGV